MQRLEPLTAWVQRHQRVIYVALDLPLFAVTYGFLVLLGHRLTGQGFGEINGALALFSLLTSVGVTLQAVVARRVAASKGRVGLREFWILGASLVALSAITAMPGIVHSAHITAIAETGSDGFVLALFLHLIISIFRGVLQGREQFLALWAAQASEHLIRLLALIAITTDVATVRQAWTAVLAGNLIHVLVGACFLGRPTWRLFVKPSNAALPVGPEVLTVLIANLSLGYFLAYDVLFASLLLEQNSGAYVTASKVGRILYFAGASLSVVLLPRFARPGQTSGERTVTGLIAAAVLSALLTPVLGTVFHPLVAAFFPPELVPTPAVIAAALFGNIGLAACHLLMTWHIANGNRVAIGVLAATGVLATGSLLYGSHDLVFFTLSTSLFAWIAALSLALLGIRTANQTPPNEQPLAIHTFYGTPVPISRRANAPAEVTKPFVVRGEWMATVVAILLVFPWLGKGQITFGDLAFGRSSLTYLNYVGGVYNEQLGTPNWFNLPRIFFIGPAYLASALTDFNGNLFLAALLGLIFLVSIWCFGKLYRTITDQGPPSHWSHETALALAALVYTINPWVIVRVQHIFLLCGYALVPGICALGWVCWGPAASRGFRWVPTASEFRYLLLLGLTCSASFAGIHFGFWSLLLLSVIGAVCAGRALPEAWRQGQKLPWLGWFSTRAVLAGLAFACFAAFWIVPFAQSLLSGVRPSQNNVNTFETVVMLSRNSTLGYVVAGASYWWPMFDLANLGWTFWGGAWALLAFGLIGVRQRGGWALAAATLALWLLATGTRYEILAPYYLSMVFEAKYPLGDMIRDPNKIYGAALLPMALLIGWGWKSLFLRRVRIGWLALSVGMLAWISWVQPYYSVFMLGYYAPIEWPAAHYALHDQLKDLPPNSKVLYLPVADHVVNISDGLAHPDFNEVDIDGAKTPKATGDHMVFDSPVDTVFPYEGNDTAVGYVLRMIQDQLDRGDTKSALKLAKLAGVTHIVQRTDHEDFRARLRGIRQLLDQDSELRQIWSNDVLALYELKAAPTRASVVPSLAYTTGGLNRLLRYSAFFDNELGDSGVVFAHSGQPDVAAVLRPEDYVEVESLEDLVLSQLSEDEVTFPADAVRRASPALGWAKMAISGLEWPQYLRTQGLSDTAYDLDHSRAVATTTAARNLAMGPYQTPQGRGTERFGTESVLHSDWLSSSTGPLLVDARAGTDGLDVLLHRSEPTSGDPAWDFFESSPLAVDASDAYALLARVADEPGHGDLEIRLGFYDREGRRLGTEFVEPKKQHPWSTDLEGEVSFVPPVGTTAARLEFRVRRTWKSGDQLHVYGIRLLELGAYSIANRLPVVLRHPAQSDPGKLWIRMLCSPKGGPLEVKWSAHSTELNSHCSDRLRFVWKSVPTTETFSNLELENRHGLQAINAVVWISDADFKERVVETVHDFEGQRTFTLVDATDGDIQRGVPATDITRVDANAVFGPRAQVAFPFDIPQAGDFDVLFGVNLPIPGDELTLSLKGPNTSEELHWTGASPPTSLHRHFGPGRYQVVMTLNGESPPLMDWDALKDPFQELSDQPKTLRRRMTRGQDSWGSLMTDPARLSSATPVMSWFSYKTVGCHSFHGKLFFYGANGETLETRYIDTLENPENRGSYSMTVEPPPGAVSVAMQFLAKPGNAAEGESWFSISDFALWESDRTPSIDALALVESGGSAAVAATATLEERALAYRRLRVRAGPRSRALLLESPLPYWEVTQVGQSVRDYAVNAVAIGMDAPEGDSELVARVPFNRTWWAGIAAVGAGLLAIGVLSIRRHRPGQAGPPEVGDR